MRKIIRLGTIKTGRRHASVFCNIKVTDGELSICGVEGPLPSGNCLGGCGQIVMSLKPRDIKPAPAWDYAKIREFLKLWDQWHLNHMRAGCAHQRERGEREVGKPCEVCGYRYGSAWLKEPLPQHVVDFMASLPETDKTPAWV